MRWKWVVAEKAWYRWYDSGWHYWGPSKKGFTAAGWTWYKGYWHHSGYVFRFARGRWYRFQAGRWVLYGARVPVKPAVPRGPKICRPFLLLKKWGFPSSLSAKKMPRCKVGTGPKAAVFMWTNDAACRFLGGRLVHHKRQTCKLGKPHSWKRVVRCVQGPVLSGKGFNYKPAGKKEKVLKKKENPRKVVNGMLFGDCYRFRAFDNKESYFGDTNGLLYSKSNNLQVWRVI